jgi:hypothetical protein
VSDAVGLPKLSQQCGVSMPRMRNIGMHQTLYAYAISETKWCIEAERRFNQKGVGIAVGHVNVS